MMKISEVFRQKFIFLLLFIVATVSVSFYISTVNMWSSSSLWVLFVFNIILIIVALIYLYKIVFEKLLVDIEALSNYVDAISNKEYEIALHVENYYEFLHISVKLKNLVKRLNNRDKKASKKQNKK